MLIIASIKRPNVLEHTSVCLPGEALDQPVDRWLKKAQVLFHFEAGMALDDDRTVKLEHELRQDVQIVFALGIHRMAHSG